jgi:hypothetical protein
VTAAAPVLVTAMSEHPSGPQGRCAVVVQVPAFAGRPAIVGVATRGRLGWTAGVRAGAFRRRILYSEHDSAHAAVGAIMGSRVGRSLGIRAWSDVRWSDAAGRAARDAWGAGVTR